VRDEYIEAHPTCQATDEVAVRDHQVLGNTAKYVDHIRPRKQGGDDSWDNLQSLCPSCHSRKTIEENINPNPYYRGKQ
jgi:5-methylcytosine-specific restriction endonuclease McrA